MAAQLTSTPACLAAAPAKLCFGRTTLPAAAVIRPILLLPLPLLTLLPLLPPLLLQLPAKISQFVKEHQLEGIKFMWDSAVLPHEVAPAVTAPSGSQEEEEGEGRKEDIGGCILAHSMGLGKTLQVIALMHCVAQHNP